MKQNTEKPSTRQRLKELAVDYLVIVAYLLVLATVTMFVYMVMFGGVPSYSEAQSQLVAFFASVVPIVTWFSYLDYAKSGTYGKKAAGLKLEYKTRAAWRSVVRNSIKFMPWQLAHQGVIHGMFTNFSALAIVLIASSYILTILLVAMIFMRSDGRHLGDILAGTRVISKVD